MPIKGGRLAPQEQALIAARARGASLREAAREAGYSRPDAASRALARPEVLAELQAAQYARLIQEGVPLAVSTLCEIAGDARQPAASRVAASRIILDRGLPAGDAARDKRPEDMSGEELARAIAALQRRASDLAKPVLEAEVREAPSVLD